MMSKKPKEKSQSVNLKVKEASQFGFEESVFR